MSNKQHPYTEILHAIADGKVIQRLCGDDWVDQDADSTLYGISRRLYPIRRYRIKPATRMINGREVPAPQSEEPERGQRYFLPHIYAGGFHTTYTWNDDGSDARALKRGLVFLDQEGAIATAKAMLNID